MVSYMVVHLLERYLMVFKVKVMHVADQFDVCMSGVLLSHVT